MFLAKNSVPYTVTVITTREGEKELCKQFSEKSQPNGIDKVFW